MLQLCGRGSHPLTALEDLWSGLARAPLPAPLRAWAAGLPRSIEQALAGSPHGELDNWRQLLRALPAITPSSIALNQDVVRIGARSDLAVDARARLEAQLRALHPWRKGPFELFGIGIDAEWRSDRKWARLADAMQPLGNRTVLDVGCGNGYYVLRMLGCGAARVVGIDPTLRYVAQFAALRHFLGDVPAHVLPLGIDDLPADLRAFDTVFSMGVLYHRRSPVDHLLALRDCLRPGGELVLETLVVDGDDRTVMLPPGRYAKMRNVWFLPSVPALEAWLRRCGFGSVRTVDVSVTSLDEQRSTDWMQFHSLADFLDRDDRSRTVEGLPAPRRAVVLARAG